jgi:hypothetical protein
MCVYRVVCFYDNWAVVSNLWNVVVKLFWVSVRKYSEKLQQLNLIRKICLCPCQVYLYRFLQKLQEPFEALDLNKLCWCLPGVNSKLPFGNVSVDFHQGHFDHCLIQLDVFHEFFQLWNFAFLLGHFQGLQLMEFKRWPSEIFKLSFFFGLGDFSFVENSEAILVLGFEFGDVFDLIRLSIDFIETSGEHKIDWGWEKGYFKCHRVTGESVPFLSCPRRRSWFGGHPWCDRRWKGWGMNCPLWDKCDAVK